MKPTKNDTGRRTAGYTLIELLMVLGLFGTAGVTTTTVVVGSGRYLEARVYENPSGVNDDYVESQVLSSPVEVDGDSFTLRSGFGASVALSDDGEWLAVGAPTAADPDDVSGSRHGAVVLYRRACVEDACEYVLYQVIAPAGPGVGLYVAFIGEGIFAATGGDSTELYSYDAVDDEWEQTNVVPMMITLSQSREHVLLWQFDAEVGEVMNPTTMDSLPLEKPAGTSSCGFYGSASATMASLVCLDDGSGHVASYVYRLVDGAYEVFDVFVGDDEHFPIAYVDDDYVTVSYAATGALVTLSGSYSELYSYDGDTLSWVLDGPSGGVQGPSTFTRDLSTMISPVLTETPASRSALFTRFVFPSLSGLGEACSAAEECESGFCADGVCCNTACGDGATNDCMACSVAASGSANGTCGAVTAGAITCRTASGVCDVAEVCDGSSMACPADAKVADGTSCDDSVFCNGAEACFGGICTTDPLSCDDGNPCTTDSCDEGAHGCAHVAVCGPDAGPPDVDAAVSAPDGAVASVDAGASAEDSGVVAHDAHVVVADGGALAEDASVVVDAGGTLADSGVIADAEAVSDATVVDDAAAAVDAGSLADSAVRGDGGEDDGAVAVDDGGEIMDGAIAEDGATLDDGAVAVVDASDDGGDAKDGDVDGDGAVVDAGDLNPQIHGCGCVVGSDDPRDGAGTLGVLLLAALGLIRRGRRTSRPRR